MGDWTYINGLFQAAANLYGIPGEFVSINVTLVSNEVSGAVSYGSGQLIFQPGRWIIVPPTGRFGHGFAYYVPATFSNPVGDEAVSMWRLLNTNTVAEVSPAGSQPFNYAQPLDRIALVITAPGLLGGAGSASITPGLSQGGQPQNLTNVDALANVVYGAGPGITQGENALYSISLNGAPQALPQFE